MRALISFILLFTVSCTHTIHNRGVPGINVELWSKIKVGDDKEKVVHTLGSPTLVSKFDENVWYYVSYKIKQANFLGKRKYSSKSLQISFDQSGEITDIREVNVAERSLTVIY
ncbi:Putative lipoprotein [Wolbachia endosymbiont of Armadillidium vulgare str. wVulC]|uniref:Outer membrane protein assembly factor BamE n=1 Tax=Wolbachia endosymbiont of Armadillidium arcangelii TaxID=3158571 RepID=A0AAU7Q3G4_9RICK|nr:outer membrane protein assembly factor BamE [Wolbachia endosymbiont of Armadillidium vulgare]RDD35259.1 outer membrane protein assembly factor BamE [Wolbachia endosymbiont of Cylisticus convexus]KLT22177.1 Putative lipoprotein [Wolbachia endosymbiont of Armadillidium vulgare str. wVulC]OJH31540.1 Outer membrane protein assembly factor BamE precursor [Wolbachia endosymbiont of Armadillidium vulgare]OJH32238.1 Outer membrane protein assembly factor BamE precursor [Wolbachia endosymbiont of Arm